LFSASHPRPAGLRHHHDMTRAAHLGITIGTLPSGPTGSIIDVPGVGVGHATVWRDEPPPPGGRGVARTGVTVVDPGGNLFRSPVPAGGAVLNGAGECTGFLSATEWGLAETPVFLTSTMQVGRVYDAACELLMAADADIGTQDVIIPIVAECDDSFLSDPRRMQVSADDVLAALQAARACGARAPGARAPAGAGTVAAAPAEGAVGSGTGMSCLGYKGGIGSASRLVPSGHTVGVLVMANFGDRERLTIDGVPAGRLLAPPAGPASRSAPPAGSCIVVIVTDGPLDAAACARLARRAGLGLARTGSTAHHASGEIFLALATGLRAPRGERPSAVPLSGTDLDPFFAAVVEATEEAVLNCLLAAPTVTGRDGNTSYGLPADEVATLLRAAGRI
jgi:D-aminopeptidase